MRWTHIARAMILALLFSSPVSAACITGTPCALMKPLVIRPAAPTRVAPSANPSATQNGYPSAYSSAYRSAYPTAYPGTYPNGGFAGGGY
jgi:hypothetical protein